MPTSVVIPFALYLFALVAAAGFWFSRIGAANPSAYFLAGRSLGSVSLGLSLFVTTLSAEWVLGAAGVSVEIALIAGGGIAVAVWILAPKLVASRPFTLPQFVGWRFNQRTGLLLSGGAIVFTLAVRVPLVIMTGSWMLHRLTGCDLLLAGVLLVFASGVLVAAGGCAAMVGGQALQGIVAFAGAGGLAAWLTTAADFPLRYVPANTLGVPELPWPAAVVGACVIALWYWTGDHFVVQRFLAARDLKTIRRGAFIAAIMVLLAAPFVFPLPLQDAGTQPLPPVAAGMLATVICAVVMAAMAGYFHSAAALFTMDFYVARHSAASDRRLVKVGRIATAVFVAVALVLVSFLALTAWSNTVLVHRLQMYLAAPVSALMIAVLFSKRTIARGAAIGLAAGGAVEVLHATAWMLSPGGTLDGLAGIETAYVAFAAFAVTLLVVLLSGTPATPATPSGITVIPRPGGSLRMSSGWRRST